VGEDLEPLAVNEALFAAEQRRERDATVLSFEYRGPEGEARKELRLVDGGLVELSVEVPGQQGWGLLLGPGIREADPAAQRGTMGFGGPAAIYSRAGEVETVRPGKVREVQWLPGAGVTWAGLEDNYFLSAVAPARGTRLQSLILQPVLVVDRGPELPAEHVAFTSEDDLLPEQRRLPRDVQVILQPASDTLHGTAFFGAKEYERLRGLGLGMERSVQWGWFGFLVRPLLMGLVWIHANIVANYGWAIVLMTIALKIVLFPLTHKSIVSMQKMQVLQPKIQAIRQKYKGKLRDKRGRMDMEQQRKMNEEMQALFRAEGASPTGGCLPLLLQIPVFFAFFRLLITTVELRQEPWALWIRDVSVPDPWYILPVVMGLTQVYQQRLTPMATDPMQRRIMQLFPWMFMIFAFSFPSGVVLYWTVNNVLTIFQTKGYKALEQRRKAAEAGREPRKAAQEKAEGKGAAEASQESAQERKGGKQKRGGERRARRAKG
jgi:YidC/Oxa1 family membrane protein insertase